MGKFVEMKNTDIVKYEAIAKKPFDKVLALGSILKFYKINYFCPTESNETFYDTSSDVLANAGITLSRIQEGNKVFFKVEQLPSLFNTKKATSKVFVHKVGVRDKLSDHAFYLVDGIKSIFSTQFSVDLENIIKNAIPKITINIKSQVYKVISGTGFRAYIALEDITYRNHITKKKYKVQGLTVKNESGNVFENEFIEFNKAIDKYCKELIQVHDVIYEHAKKVTRKVEKPKLTKEEKEKLKKQQKKQDKF